MVETEIGEGLGGLAASSVGVSSRMTVAVVGVSVNAICGAHDHAVLLADALSERNISHTMHWLRRDRGSVRASRSEIRAWSRSLSGELERARPDAVLLHYSVFSYSHRGVPLFVRPVLSALRRSRAPVVIVLHEFAYAWFLGGARGKVWALTQRAVLVDVMRACAGALVTTDLRAEWLASRPWLPRRPVAFAPVFSNLPAPRPQARPPRRTPVVGLFGYSSEGSEAATVLDAVRALSELGVEVQLMLLGSDGGSSGAGEAWTDAARTRGVLDALAFSGTLPAQDLSDALARCDVLLSAFISGPSARKGTLAASLASGRPVIAMEGPRGWGELIESDALQLVEPTAQALARAIRALLEDADRREALGARGRVFAERRMGVARTAEAVIALLGDVVSDGEPIPS